MALSVETAQKQLIRAEQALARIQAEYDAAAAAYNAERIAGNVQRGTAEYLALRQKYNIASLEAQVETATIAVREARQELNAADAEAQSEANAQRATTQRSNAAVAGSDSAGQIAQEDAATTGNAPPVQVLKPDGRIAPAPENPSGSNATVTVTRDAEVKDTGTDEPVKAIEETQAVTSTSSQGFPITVGDRSPQTVFSGGVGAENEDASGRKNTTQQAVASTFDQTVSPQANVLDKYYNYTYNAEIWLMKPSDYKELIQTKKWGGNGGLLMRSGGIPETASGGSVTATINGQTGTSPPTRNPYFSLDYYIDSIELSNYLPGKGSGAPHNNTALKFTVTEPNGITLIENLVAATNDYCGIQNYTAAIYMMKISFYGYDETGVLQKVNNNDVNTPNDPYAVVTKYVPFLITNITFSVSNSLVTYTVNGSPTGQDVGVGQSRGSIPYNIEVAGSTVGQVLGNDIGGTTTNATLSDQAQANQFQANTNTSILSTLQTTGGPSNNAPPKADAATNQTPGTIVGGLMGALNEFQRRLVKTKVFDIADEYSIEFALDEMRGARVRKALKSSYSNTPMTNNANPRSLLDETQAMNPNQRIVGITAGMPIVQAIDLVLRNSEYIEKQQLAQINETTGEVQNNPQNAKTFAWFKISIVTEQKAYDIRRNDYAYKIKFIVSPYEIKGMDSPWFPTGNFSGVHKSYPYWFTGQNTAVIDYQQSYNHNYRTTLSGANKNPQRETSDLQKIRKYWYAPRSNQTSQQGDNAVNEPAANASEFLYSQADLGKVKIRILGDPAWIIQGEMFAGVDARQFVYKPFLPDGTINIDAGEILFEIVWVRNGDYDIETGLMKPNLTGKSYNKTSKQSFVYKANEVTSFFMQGKFEQTVAGNLYIFPIPNTTQQATNTNQDTGDLSQASTNQRSASGLRNASQVYRSAQNPAQDATDTLATPESNYSSSPISTDRFAGQARTDAITGSNNLGTTTQISAPAVLPAGPAENPTSQGTIDTPTVGLAGIQYNVNTFGAANEPIPATLPGIQVNIIPTTDRQLMVKET
jgi:hypothetical protein